MHETFKNVDLKKSSKPQEDKEKFVKEVKEEQLEAMRLNDISAEKTGGMVKAQGQLLPSSM